MNKLALEATTPPPGGARLLTYPARPVAGGHLKHALPKVGQWSYEPKYNGWRAIVHTPTGAMWNRHGEPLSIAGEFKAALEALRRSPFEWLDVEALERRHGLGRGCLVVLDIPSSPLPYAERTICRARLAPILAYSQQPLPETVYVPPICGEETLPVLWNGLQSANGWFHCQFYEGVVAKKTNSLYPVQLHTPGQTFPGWMKHRFVK